MAARAEPVKACALTVRPAGTETSPAEPTTLTTSYFFLVTWPASSRLAKSTSELGEEPANCSSLISEKTSFWWPGPGGRPTSLGSRR